jgi:hypothetical protein
MELRILVAVVMFFGSYFPLALILFVQDIDVDLMKHPVCRSVRGFFDACAVPLLHPKIASSVLVMSLMCLSFFLFSLKCIQSTHDVDIKESKHIPADLMSYVFPYIVSFMSFDYSSVPKICGAFLFLSWMFLITYRSGNILLNPLLAVFGWKLFEIKFTYPTGTTDHQRRAMSRSEIVPKSRYKVFAFQDVFIATKKGE